MSRILLLLVTCLGHAPYLIAHHYSRSIHYPLSNIDRSIELPEITNKLPLQTGKCESYNSRDLILTLPGTAPRNLYPGFINSYRVSCLSLTDSSIDTIDPNSFLHIANLLYLDLSRNRIQLCDLPNLRNLDLLRTLVIDENDPQGQQQRDLTLSLSYFPRLEHLYLRKNFLRDITINLRHNFPSLTHLYLSDNHLEGRTFRHLQLPSALTHLHLERNKIQELSTGEFINLSSLFLDGNKICSITSWQTQRYPNPLVLRAMGNLKFLSLLKNDISYMDRDSFAESRGLQSLNLAHNSISTIYPGTFDVLRQLTDLSLSHNRLTVVPDVSQLMALGSLSLDHNYIDRISTNDFANLHRLRWLSLGSNRINTIERGAFVNLVSLEELDLSDNQLSYLPWGWISNACIQHLDVRNNLFTSIGSLSLDNIWTLTHLYVQGTPLSNVITSGHWQINSNTTVHLKYTSSVVRGPCYVDCYGGYIIPRRTFQDEWTW